MKLKKWHSTEITDVLQKLNSTEEGSPPNIVFNTTSAQ